MVRRSGPSGPPAATPIHITARELAWAGAGFAIVILLFTAPLIGRIATELSEPVADPRLNAWILAWGADRLPHLLDGFWSPPIFHPYTNTLAYSENLLGIAVFVAPVYWVSKNPILTYNAAFLLAYLISALGAYVLTRELTGRRDAAVVAGCAFAFAPYRWAQLPHLQVLTAGWLPLVLYAVHRGFRTPSWGVGAFFAAAFVITAFSNGYAAYQAAFAAALVGCWLGVTHGVTRRQLAGLAAAATAVGVVLAPAVVTHMDVWTDRSPASSELVRFSIDLSNYLSVASQLPHAGWLPGIAQSEGRYFPGIVVTVLALAALAPASIFRSAGSANRWRWPYVALAFVGAWLSLGPRPRAWGLDLPLPPVYDWFHQTLPLFHALRVPARFGMLVVLAASVLAGMGAARVLALMSRRKRVAALSVLLPIIVWEGWGGPLPTASPVFGTARGDDAAYAWVESQPRGVLLDLPSSGMGPGRLTMKAQYAALRHGQPIVGGVSRVRPPLGELLNGPASPLVDPALRSQVVPFLRGLDVRYVLFRPGLFHDAGQSERLLEAFETSEAVRRTAVFDDVHAFEIAPSEFEESAPSLVELPSSSYSLSASPNGDRASLAIDGRVETRWLSGAPQSGREWIELTFDRPRDIGRIDLVTAPRSLHDFPRSLEVVATAFSAQADEQVLFRGPILEQYGRGFLIDPEQPVIAIDLPTFSSARVRLRQIGRTAPWYWSIDELVVWERPLDPRTASAKPRSSVLGPEVRAFP